MDIRDRDELRSLLEPTLGEEATARMLEQFPAVDPTDLTTKDDLQSLEARSSLQFEAIDRRFEAIDRRFEAVDRRFEAVDRLEAMGDRITAAFRKELNAQTRTFMLTMLGIVVTLASTNLVVAFNV